MWQLIICYQITDSGHGPKTLLLNWLRRCLPEKVIGNLTTDWKDGFLLSSLVNFCDSSLIIDHLYLDADDAFQNVQSAMKLAEEHFKIPQLLKPEDFVCERPDENSIMTYLSYFCQGQDSPGQKMLLEWIQEQIKDSSITNFTDVWTDGRKLALLVHILSNNGFQEYADLDWKNPVDDCRLVMEVADKLLGIDLILTPSQFIDPSLNQIERVTYLLQFFFSSHQAHVHELHVPEEAGTGATVWLDISLPEGSTKEIEVFVRGRQTDEVPTSRESLDDGIQRIKFDAEVPDRYYFSVSIGGVRLKGSPFTIDLTPPDPETVQLIDEVLPTKAGIPAILVLKARDTSRGKLTAEVTGELSGVVPHLIDTVSSTIYKVSFIPMESERYTVDVRLDGLHTKGSPFTVSLDSLIQPERIIIGKPVKTIAGEPVHIPINTTDAGHDKLSAKCSGATSGDVDVAFSPPDDPTEIVFTPPVEDTYNISIFFGNTEVTGSPLVIKMYDVPTDAKKVHLIRPPAGSVAPGTEIKVGFDASDAGPGEMTASCIGRHFGDMELKVVDEGNECYDVTFTPTESDIYEIAVLWSGDHVPGSPFNMNLIPRDAPDPTKCKVVDFPEPSAILLTDEEVHFTVDTTVAGLGYLDVVIQVESHAIEDDRVSMISTGTRGSDAGTAELEPERDEGELKPIHEDEEEGKKDEQAAAETHEEEGQTTATSTEQTTEGEGEKDAEHHEEEEEEEEEVIKPAPKLSIEPSEENPRIYNVTYVPVEGGNHLLNVYWSDQTLPNSPYSLNIYDPQLVDYNKPISVHVKTAYKRKHLKMKLQHRDGTVVAKPNIRMDKITAGDYVLVFTPTQPDTYVLYVTAKNRPITGSPFVIKYCRPEITEEQLQGVHVIVQTDKVHVGSVASFLIESKDPSLLDELVLTKRYTEEEGGAAESSKGLHMDRKKDGSVFVTFNLDGTKDEYVEVKIRDKEVPGSPFHFAMLKPEPSEAKAEAVKPKSGGGGDIFGLTLDEQRFVTGTPSKFKLICDDLGEGELKVLCKPSSHAEISVKEDESEPKVYWVTVTPTKAGKCNLLMRYGGHDINGSPFPINVLARGNAKKCILISSSDCPQPENEVEKSFCVSTKGAGKGKITAIMKSIMNNKKVDVKVEQHSKNHYHLTFIPTEGLNYMLTVRFDDVDINGSPYKILLGNPTHCKAEGEGIDQPWSGRLNKFIVDSTNAGPGELSVLIEQEAEDEESKEETLKVEPNITKVDDFQYEVLYKPSLPGVYWITVKWHDQNIGGSPFKSICKKPLEPSEFSVKDLVPATHAGKATEWVVVSERTIEESDKISVVVFDAEGDDETEKKEYVAEVSRNEDGRSYSATLPSLLLGKYSVFIVWDKQHIRGSPFNITAHPVPEIDQFSMEASENDKGDIVMNVSGPEFAFQLGQLTASLQREDQGSPEETPIDIAPSPNNRDCVVTFRPHEVGEYKLSVLYNDQHFKGSPFGLISTDASYCYHSGKGLVSAQVHQSNKFTVFTENAGPGDLKVEVEAEVDNEGDILLVPAVVPREDKTTYDVSYISNFTGHYKISVFWDIHHIPGSPFEVICCDPTRYSVINPPTEGILGQPTKIGVKESTMGPSYEKLSVYARGKDHKHHEGTVMKDDDGNYVCAVSPPELGKYVVHVQCNGYDITGSPFKIKNMPPPIADKVIVSGPGIKDGSIGQKGSFEIDVSQAGFGYIGLRVQGPKHGFTVQLTESKGEEGQKVMAEYNPTHAGQYLIGVLWAGVHVPESPFTVNIEEAGVSMQAVQ